MATTDAPAETVADWDDLAEYLANLNAFAKRQPAITAKLSCDRPTDWDKAHARIDAALYDIQATTKPCA